MKKLLITTITSFVFFIGLSSLVSAATVSISIDREYTVQLDSNVNVRETRVIKNNTSDRTITKEGNYEIFTITALYDDETNLQILQSMVKSVVVKGEGDWNLQFTTEYKNNSVLISVPYPEAISPLESYTFTFEYLNSQLSKKSGALTDVYIQAFSEDFSFSTGNVDYSYSTILKVPRSTGDENFVIPQPLSKTVSGDFDVYSFSQEQLLGTYVWVQRGTQQNYKFSITQNISATESSNTGNKNEYRMIIPRSSNGVKTTQTVYFTNISPSPKSIEQDFDGNLIGVFEFTSHENGTILIEGYATVISNPLADIKNSGKLIDLSQSNLPAVYTSDAPFWEVSNSQIQQKALALKGNNNDIYTILEDTYSDIVASIDYSQVKRFGINERQGALKTLNGGAAVCMEYSDLYIALLRAQGIPARAVFGYGYDSKDPADKQELHQWVQAYIPSQNKWLNIDVTWGENGPALIGGDMNHFITHVASVDPNSPATLSGKTFGGGADLTDAKFSIEVLESLPDVELRDVDTLLAEFPSMEESTQEKILNSFMSKLTAGWESILNDGINFQNSAQIIVFATLGIFIILLIITLTLLLKLVGRRKIERNLHALRSINS